MVHVIHVWKDKTLLYSNVHEEIGINPHSERNVHMNRIRSGTLQLKWQIKRTVLKMSKERIVKYAHCLALLHLILIKSDLDKVYGDSALSYATVRRWVRLFTSGRESIKDEASPGRPVTTMTDENIAAVKKAVEDDARCTVEEISSLCGINSSSVFVLVRTQTDNS